MDNEKVTNEQQKKSFAPCYIEIIHLDDVILTSITSSANGDETEEDLF